MHLRVIALFSTALVVACPERERAVATAIVDAGAAQASPLDAAKVLALVTENAPGVEVSLQQRGADLVLELRGHSGPAVALAQLASLPPRLPGLRATRLQLDESGWQATVTLAQGDVADATALTMVLAAAAPVFTGERALLATGAVDVTPALLSFKGTLAPGRSIADAGDVIASGYSLRKVEAGPPFILEIAP